MEINNEKKCKSRFKVTGIVLLNRQKVLDMLPKSKQFNENTDADIAQVLKVVFGKDKSWSSGRN